MPLISKTGLAKSIRNLRHALESKQTSVTQNCKRSLETIQETQHLNSFVTTFRNAPIEEAELLDESLIKNPGQLRSSSLFGAPISIKDNFCISNSLTTCGSKMLRDFVPPYTATVVDKLKDAGCIIMGKTNMDEFAMGSSSTTSHYGPTLNNCDHIVTDNFKEGNNPQTTSDWYMAGGSSTGSAVSVATGACLASIGTDTGGSTRQPASLTGIVGFKPTYGLISRHGLVPLAHSLDVVSILARDVCDTRLVFDCIIGLDHNDLTSVDHTKKLITKFNKSTKDKLTLRVGVPTQLIENSEGLAHEVASRFYDIISAISNSELNIKFEFVDLRLENSKLATECYTIISSAEIASNMNCYDGVKYGHSSDIKTNEKYGNFDRDLFYMTNRNEAFGSEVKKRILLGNYFLLSGNRDRYLTQAFKLRRLIMDEFDKTFIENKLNFIMMPSTPTTSVTYAEWKEKQQDNKLFREDYFLIPANLANLPSISLPCGNSRRGLPFGIQLIGQRFNDYDLLSYSEILESHVFNQF